MKFVHAVSVLRYLAEKHSIILSFTGTYKLKFVGRCKQLF